MSVFKSISRAMPKPLYRWAEKRLVYAGVEKHFDIILGKFIVFYILACITLPILANHFLETQGRLAIMVCIACVSLVSVVSYIGLLAMMDKRSTYVEEILPDALLLIASNIKSGLTPDKALIVSARPEFGPLEVEIKRAVKRTFAGGAFENALLRIKDRIRSTQLERTMDLIVEGIRGGGELAILLEETARDIRSTELVRREVRTNVMMYVIFIFMATAFAGPMLYSVSIYLVETMGRFSAGVSVPEDLAAQMPIKMTGFSGMEFGSVFLILFSMANVVVSTFFGGIIIGLIETGRESAGIRYIPPLLAIGLAVFFVTRFLLTTFLGTII